MSHISKSILQQPDPTQDDDPNQQPSFPKMVKNLVSCTFYTVIGYICLDIMLAISLHFIQKDIGNYANAGFGLSYTIVNIIVIPLGLGLNQSLNVNAAQAIGADKKPLASKYLTITFYCHLAYFVPFFAIIMLLKNAVALTIPEQDREQTIVNAYLYMPYLLFSTQFAVQFEGIKSYLIAYKITRPFMFIHTFTVILHYFWCYFLIQYLKWGVHGGGIATVITELSNCVIIIIWIKISSLKQVFVHFQFSIGKGSKEIIKGFLNSSFAIISHIYLDFFVFFFMTFVALRFGNNIMNAQMALSNTSALFYRFPISLSLALMTYVGHEMGRLDIKRAKQYTIAGLVFLLMFIICFSIVFWILRIYWADFYSDSDGIKEQMLQTFPIFIFGLVFMDGIQGTLSGVLKGINHQNLVSYSTLISYYIIGIPLILYFSCDFGMQMKLKGIWLGFTLTNASLVILFIIVLFTSDWRKQSLIIKQKLEDQEIQRESLIEASVKI